MLKYKILAVVAIITFSFLSGWTANGWRLNSYHSKEIAALLRANTDATSKRDSTISELRLKNIEDSNRIADLSRGARVRTCPTNSSGVPASGDSTDTSAKAHSGAGGEDITELLRWCAKSFGEINRAVAAKDSN